MASRNSLIIVLISVFYVTLAVTEPFKIGAILPMSGAVAIYGQASINGASLFQTDFPENNLKIIVEDSRYEPSVSVTAYNKLTRTDKVDLVYVWGTGPAAAIAPLSESNKIPTILMTGDTADVVQKKYSICFSNQLRDYSLAIMRELRRRNKKKIALVKTEIQFLETLVNEMQKNLESSEEIDVIESFPPDYNNNFQSVLTKLKSKQSINSYDTLGVMLISGQLSSFYKTMGSQNLKLDTFSSDFLESVDERNRSGASITGAFYPVLDVQKSFAKKYQGRFNTADQVGFAAGFYDFVALIDDLFSNDYRNGKKLAPEQILEKIESVKTRNGVSGRYDFMQDDPMNDPIGGKRFRFPIVIKEISNDRTDRILP